MRTPGSGWGNGHILNWQVCPHCGKKKVLYDHPKYEAAGSEFMHFKCHACKKEFNSDSLTKSTWR